VLSQICNRVAVIEDGAIAEQFALDDAADLATPRKTALGRELAQHGAAAGTVGTIREALYA
jgi:D-methionine transport system ATP-binding protein